MSAFLEQAEAARRAASEIRVHLQDLDGTRLVAARKLSDRLEARAAELEYRWLTLTASPADTSSTVGLWRVMRQGG